jgi:hypothetical protein
MKTRICALTILLAAVAPVGAGQRVSLRVTPWVSFAPADLRVRAIVDQNPDNRTIEVIAESDEFYRASEIELAGELAPRTTMVEFRNLPSGEYAVRAIVKGTGGKTLGITEQTIRVVESGAAR